MYEFMAYKISYLFGYDNTKWDAWVTSIEGQTPSAAETAAIAKFSGKTLSVYVNMTFLPGFPTTAPADPEYVTKWSGGCL